MPRGKRTALTTAQEKKVALNAFAKNKNLNCKNLAFCTSSLKKKLELSISAEIGEKIRRETEPK